MCKGLLMKQHTFNTLVYMFEKLEWYNTKLFHVINSALDYRKKNKVMLKLWHKRNTSASYTESVWRKCVPSTIIEKC